MESLRKFSKPGDYQVSGRVRNRIRRAGGTPLSRAVDEYCPEPFAASRIEIEIVAGDHQDFAGRGSEELCSALISLGSRFVTRSISHEMTASQSIPLRRETSITNGTLRMVNETQT